MPSPMGIYACVRFILRKPPSAKDHDLDKRTPEVSGTSITNISMRMMICRKYTKNTSTCSHTPKTLTLLESIPKTFPQGQVVFKPSYFITFKYMKFVEALESSLQLFKRRPFMPNER
jgi:hypothetical protein